MGDIYFSNVSLLLPFDGANGSTSFPDASSVSKTVSTLGNTVISSTQSKFGGTSGYFDGNGDYLTVPASSDFDFPSDFTIEFYVYLSAYSAAFNGAYGAAIVARYYGFAGQDKGWQVRINGTASSYNTINVYTGVTDLYFSASFNLNTWHHVAVTRSGSSLKAFLDGVQVGTTVTNSDTFTQSTPNPLYIGRLNDSSYIFYLNGYIDSLRITKGIARYTANFTPPTTAFPTDWEEVPDPYYDNVVLHLPMDGPENGTTFIDRSLSPKTITTVGNTSLKIAQSKFGGRSCYFDGAGDYLELADSEDFNFGSGDFTIEAWVYGTGNIVSQWPGIDATYCSWLFTVTGAYKLQLNYGVSTLNQTLTGANTITPNAWNHVVVTKNNGLVRFFINGVIDPNTFTISGSLNNSSYPIRVGTADLVSYFSGYIDSLRITKGVARYAANFTVPTGPFAIGKPYVADPYASNVKLLLTGSGAHGTQIITDESPTANAITVAGNTSVDRRYSKIGGGSVYFDGSGDYLSIAANSNLLFGTGNFTIEFWQNYNALTNFQTLISLGYTPATGAPGGFIIQTSNGNGQINYYYQGSLNVVLIAGENTTISTNTWYHIAIVRNGSTLTIYRNGVSVASGVDTNNYSANYPLIIGGGSSTGFNNYWFNGYLNNLRITKGVARYTTNFTPSYTYLIGPSENLYDKTVLTLQLNGNYVDSSPKNNTVTAYGNASLSTTTYKYGTGSLYLDGVGDYIAVPDTVNLRLGTGDFCIECWVYPTMTSFADINCIFDHKTGDPSGWYLYLNWQGKVELYNSSDYLTGNTALTKNVWTHIAVTRASGTTTIWVNGVADCTPNTGTINSDFYGSTTYFAIGALVNIRQSQYDFKGYIDNVRITKGAARYTSTFTPADFESQSAVGPVRAYSTQSITSNGAVKFTIPVAGTLQAGFSVNAPTDATKTDLEYSIQISTSKVLTIVESGVVKSTVGTAADGSNFELEYSGTTIVYKINGAQLYTSTVSAGMTLYFSAFIEDVGIYITGIQIGTYASDGTPGNISGQITSSNVSTYIASAAIGSAYISNLNADKITSGTLQASTSITVGTSTDGLILDGSAKNIIAKSSNINRVKFGNLGSTYGIQGWKTGVTNPVFQLDETGLDAYIKETVLKKFGASYKMPIVIAGDYTFASNALTTNIEIPITTVGTYRLVIHVTGYWESDSLTRSAACMRYGTNGVYFNNKPDVFDVRDMGTLWLSSDNADSSGTVGPFGAGCIDVVWNATTLKLELQLKAFTNASPTGMSYFTYIIWAVDNAAYPFTTY